MSDEQMVYELSHAPPTNGKTSSALVRADFQPFNLILDPNTTFTEWEAIGDTLMEMQQSLNWWIGDWLRFGEQHFPDRYEQGVQVTGKEKQTLWNIAWVAGEFEPERRRDGLTFSHHAEVASLDKSDQDEALNRAEEEGWSTHQLRNHLVSNGKKTSDDLIFQLGTALTRAIEQWGPPIRRSGMSRRQLQDYAVAAISTALEGVYDPQIDLEQLDNTF